jgi:uncharacterized membrane protein (DUF106 family)
MVIKNLGEKFCKMDPKVLTDYALTSSHTSKKTIQNRKANLAFQQSRGRRKAKRHRARQFPMETKPKKMSRERRSEISNCHEEMTKNKFKSMFLMTSVIPVMHAFIPARLYAIQLHVFRRFFWRLSASWLNSWDQS